MNVASYAPSPEGASSITETSTKERVAQLNGPRPRSEPGGAQLLPVKATVVNSKRWGVMWHGGGTLDISGRTVFNTVLTTLLDKARRSQSRWTGRKVPS